MSLKFSVVPGRISAATVLACALFSCVISFDCAAQSRVRSPRKDGLPRVGTIKDYPATGLMTGCGNLYSYPVPRTNTSPEAYVFLSSGDGSNAWMNLGGRDVRLQQIKSLAGKDRKPKQYSYRSGSLRISVIIEAFPPEGATAGESDPMFKMKITLRRGQAVRIVRAVGDADC